jgi:hypothetical protein
VREANDASGQDRGTDFEQRQHEMSRRWVLATLRHRRAEHPDWDQHKVLNTNPKAGRPRRYEYEWRTLCGHDPADGKDHVPDQASPETVRQLEDLLDREEAELPPSRRATRPTLPEHGTAPQRGP